MSRKSLARPPLHELDALVLAGGASRRMGQPKAALPFGESTLMETVLDRLRPLFRQTVIVTKEVGPLAGLDADVVADGREQQGPPAGLARGLARINAPWCFLTGCDMPFLQPEVIRAMAREVGGCDVVAVKLDGRVQTLHAFYSRSSLGAAERLLSEGSRSLRSLIERSRVKYLGGDWLAHMDPECSSFRDLDTWADYEQALEAASKEKAPVLPGP